MAAEATPFLTAEWRRLLLVTYTVRPDLLRAYLPKGIELDRYEGQAFVSLVAFDFLNTKLKGVKIPFHTNFPEVNLRIYVRHGTQRGVVFVREYVPRFWIANIANIVYNEPYSTAKMQSDYTESNGIITIKYALK